MRKMTKKSLEEAFAGESMAHMRYAIFSDIAEEAGFKNIARLFKAISYAERVHATNHAKNLGIIKDTIGNLQTGIDGETYEISEMYPAYYAVAQLQNEKGAQQSIHYALEAEKIHAKLYEEAKEKANAGKDVDFDEIYICPVCGYTHIGTPPKKCPVCGLQKEKFRKF
jgi:rubrerythrin